MKILWLAPLLFLFISCASKVTQDTVSATENVISEEPVVAVDPRCLRFNDNSNSKELIEAHVIYRDFIRNSNFEAAFPHWRKAYNAAPKADGNRDFHFSDGVKLYRYLITDTQDESLQRAYIDTLNTIFSHWRYCYGNSSDVLGQQGFIMFYELRDYFPDSVIFKKFKEVVEADEINIPYYIINPFSELLVMQLYNKEISEDEAKQYSYLVLNAVKSGLASGKDTAYWRTVNEYAPKRLEAFEGIEGFYPCEYYMEKYIPLYLENKDSCEIINEVYGRLRWAKCETTLDIFREIAQSRIDKKCIIIQEESLSVAGKAFEDLREGRYRDAIRGFDQAYREVSEAAKKAEYAMLISKIYYAHMKDFPSSRTWALRAAGHRSNWGEPYMIIGMLYASSGPLCGPGTGFDSQIVTWPAIDKWNHAKRIDPGVAAEANKMIETYTQYMPSKEDLFVRTIEEGSPFKIGCWIQETTTARSKPQ